MSLPSYAQDARRDENGNYIFTEEDFTLLWAEYQRRGQAEILLQERVNLLDQKVENMDSCSTLTITVVILSSLLVGGAVVWVAK